MRDIATSAVATLTVVAALAWTMLILVPWRPWSTREVLDAEEPARADDLSTVTAIIPARDEAAVIARTLRALEQQGHGLKIILIDDHSSDGTVHVARELALAHLEAISSQPLPPGWSGKLWALEQGRARANTMLTLLLDADIELAPGILTAAKTKLHSENLDLLSLLAAPRMASFWEKLLLPAFVYFFKLLYPFALSNSHQARVAAAAGGFILLKTQMLDTIDGFGSLREALIDDCALAQRVKSAGGATWLALSHAVRSQRANRRLADVWNMVARTAFTQLHYSNLRLAACTLIMMTLFWTPVAALFHAGPAVLALAVIALAAMMFSYLPTLRFYGRSPTWACALPLVAAIYLVMTWDSAVRHWRGRGAAWKGRTYNKKIA
jgi:hopene-associated glycosyltransferase HpnB